MQKNRPEERFFLVVSTEYRVVSSEEEYIYFLVHVLPFSSEKLMIPSFLRK